MQLACGLLRSRPEEAASMKRFFAVPPVVLVLIPRLALGWGDDGGDHLGADWEPAAGAVVSGVHTNVGTFRLGAATAVTVGGSLEVHADVVEIDGTLSADAMGHVGGVPPVEGGGQAGEGSGGGCGGGLAGTAP